MKKILVVDDDVVIIKLFQVQIRRAGHKGYFFQESEQALKQACSICPDLAVLDYNMPGMNGMELLRALRRDLGDSAFPVIFVTGEVDADVLAGMGDAANTRLLAKPFSPRRVITMIEELL